MKTELKAGLAFALLFVGMHLGSTLYAKFATSTTTTNNAG